MTDKQLKSTDELKAALMAEVRQIPECAHVIDVVITRPASGGWNAAWVRMGNRMVNPEAHDIVRRLQIQFDLQQAAEDATDGDKI